MAVVVVVVGGTVVVVIAAVVVVDVVVRFGLPRDVIGKSRLPPPPSAWRWIPGTGRTSQGRWVDKGCVTSGRGYMTTNAASTSWPAVRMTAIGSARRIVLSPAGLHTHRRDL
jgi:hypothetical protein